MRVVRLGEGLTLEEIQAYVSRGWVCIPKATLRHGDAGSVIIVPGTEPLIGLEVVDLWYAPYPAVPRGAVIAVLQELAKTDSELLYVDFLGRHLLGMSAGEVLRYGKEVQADGATPG